MSIFAQFAFQFENNLMIGWWNHVFRYLSVTISIKKPLKPDYLSPMHK